MNKLLAVFCLLAILLTAACQTGPGPQPMPTVTAPQPEQTEPPTETAAPTETAEPPTETSAPTETVEPTPDVPPTVAPPPVNQSGVLSSEVFSIGTVAGVADSWIVSTIEGVPIDSDGPPPIRGWPPHLFVTFEEEGLPEADPENFDLTAPQGRVFPVDALREMYDRSGRPEIAEAVDQLETILADRPETFDDPIPVFPDVGATQDLRAKVTYIDFNGGSGIGFVGHYAQGPEPFTNENLVYFFQGLTGDGMHYLSFVQPLDTDFLPEDLTQVPQETLDALQTDPPAYLEEVRQTIEEADNSAFTPDLDALVAMYSSIVTGVSDGGTPGAGTATAGTPAAGTPTVGTPAAGTLAAGTATPGTGAGVGAPTSAAPGITGFLWAWEELRGAGSDNVTVTDPMSYTLTLLSDGSLAVRADCNRANGRYSLGQSGSISISISGVTRAACPEGSLSDQFLELLPSAAAYNVSGGSLTLELADGGGEMTFTVGRREIEVTAEPEAGAATVTTIDTINILSGPGGDYPSYGTVTAGTVLEVVGVSPDGEWWVVRLPPDILADGQGWVADRYVEPENAEDVPVIQPPEP